jgi:hypothetical protein
MSVSGQDLGEQAVDAGLPGGRVEAERPAQLAVSRREFFGRCAAVANSLLGTAAIASRATFTGTPAARAASMTRQA